MAKPFDQWREDGWVSVGTLASVLDVNTAFVRSEVLRRCPPAAVRRDGRRIEVYGRVAIECWLEHQIRVRVVRQLQDEATIANVEAFADELATIEE